MLEEVVGVETVDNDSIEVGEATAFGNGKKVDEYTVTVEASEQTSWGIVGAASADAKVQMIRDITDFENFILAFALALFGLK